ncbi:hypothetical protein PBY51_004622 [Eleginops maclovinus]|uniref:Matrin-type domain-containing protein n=1 Tax=Eleginops maclovinus TaxID=56733 RepID=A0AAN7Y3K6_ELEMC|nr:hypothetical protein PBY51_004622 [Eleginops maclovinus]
MVKQQRRTDRSFDPAAGSSVPRVRFPAACPVPRRSSGTTEEERGDPGAARGSAETKRPRLEGGTEEAPAIRERAPGSCDQPGGESCSPADGVSCRPSPPDQQGAAELSELQGVRSLKVTIQQRSESRAFRQTDGSAERQTDGLRCHVCRLTCRSLEVFQEHMAGSEHLKKLKEMTHSISLNTHTLQDRGRRPDSQRWCNACQTHFSGDVVIHRRTKQHKTCKQLCRPFCPVCKCPFRTPRKFVEHMKSAEHKEQVQLQEAQEEELITVDAVGCFQEEEEEEEEEEEGEEGEEGVEVAKEEGDGAAGKEEAAGVVKAEVEETQEYDPKTIYGSSFVLPVSGFLCRLCNKFFLSEMSARHTHCRTHTHFLNLQSFTAGGAGEDAPS